MADSPEVVQGEEMGLVKRMVGVFVSPGATFEAVRARVSVADWLVPLILVMIVGTVSVYMLTPLMDEMNEALKDAGEHAQAIGRVSTVIGAAFSVAIMLFVFAAILLGLARLVLGGETTYRHVLAVSSYSSLVNIPSAIVTIPLMIAKESMEVQVGLGLLLPDSMTESFLAYFLNALSVFSVWQCALTAIGLGIVSGISTKKAAIGVFVLFVLYALGAAALQGWSKGLGG